MANQELVNDMRLEAKIDGDLTYHYTSEPDFTGRAGRQNRQIWRRDELLGRGGFGEVWLERSVPSQGQNELRAVKIIPRPREDDSEGLHLLEQELQAIAKFSQPKVSTLQRLTCMSGMLMSTSTKNCSWSQGAGLRQPIISS